MQMIRGVIVNVDEYKNEEIMFRNKVVAEWVSVDDLLNLNPIIDDFSCECKNEDICAMCAFKEYWKAIQQQRGEDKK